MMKLTIAFRNFANAPKTEHGHTNKGISRRNKKCGYQRRSV